MYSEADQFTFLSHISLYIRKICLFRNVQDKLYFINILWEKGEAEPKGIKKVASEDWSNTKLWNNQKYPRGYD